MNQRIWGLVFATLVPFSLGGCLKRTELLVVHPDGRLTIYATYQGSTDDVHSGDPLPSRETGWQVAERNEINDDDEDNTTRLALKQFAADERITQGIHPHAASEDASLQVSTQVSVEVREDGTYYHLRRTLHGRKAHRLGYLHERFLETDTLKAIGEKPPGKMTDADRQAVADAFLEHAASRAELLVERAFAEQGDAVPQEAVLAVASSARRVYTADDVRLQVVAMLAGDNGGSDAVDLESTLEQAAAAGIADTLDAYRVGAPVRQRFLADLDRLRREQTVTEDIGDDGWTVTVVMPGKLLGYTRCYAAGEAGPPTADMLAVPPAEDWPEFHADITALTDVVKATETTVGVEACTWTFPGKAVYDRDVVLMATSVVTHD